MNRAVRLVIFDALHTIITPRLPIQVQYAREFEPYFGPLDPEKVKDSMGKAIKMLQAENPVYIGGASEWWSKVIERTAVGAGADATAVGEHVHEITPRLMKIFSSKEGYKEFPDTVPAFERLEEMGMRLAVVSNADSRMRLVLDDLGLTKYLDCVVLSEEVGVAKPEGGIFMELLKQVNGMGKPHVEAQECLHIGDELIADYQGAVKFGMQGLLLRRPGSEEGEPRETVQVVEGLGEAVVYVGGSS